MKYREPAHDRIGLGVYFHVVFTLPSELKPVGLRNQRVLYTLLLQAASRTLLTLGRDPKRLGASLGVTAVLHTWTRDLRFHPHAHCIVTGGGLALDGKRWVDAGTKYLFPVKVLSMLFRGKFLDGLGQAHHDGLLDLPRALSIPGAFDELRNRLFDKDWVVYCKPPFGGPEQVFAYLGKYTHRVGISNHRIRVVTNEEVTITTRGSKTATMSPHEFIRRFLLHVLPPGFVKIRHYGLWASSNVNTRLEVARRLLAEQGRVSKTLDEPSAPDDWRAELAGLTDIDLRFCPVCGSDRLWSLVVRPITVPCTQPRAPPP